MTTAFRYGPDHSRPPTASSASSEDARRQQIAFTYERARGYDHCGTCGEAWNPGTLIVQRADGRLFCCSGCARGKSPC